MTRTYRIKNASLQNYVSWCMHSKKHVYMVLILLLETLISIHRWTKMSMKFCILFVGHFCSIKELDDSIPNSHIFSAIINWL